MNHDTSFQSLMENLVDQLDFLEKSVTSYDQGYSGEVFRQALIVRLLVDDTKYSTSLLTKLDKKGIKFNDTLIKREVSPPDTYTGLVKMMELDSVLVGLPLLYDGPSNRQIDFDGWWEGIALVDNKGAEFSRKAIVAFFTNQKSEAKADSSLDLNFTELKDKNTLGITGSGEKDLEPKENDMLYASMRQITHEVLKTIKLDYTCHRDQDGTTIQGEAPIPDFMGASTLPLPLDNRPTDMVRKRVGRNDPCPCGSGRKYKKCCMIN